MAIRTCIHLFVTAAVSAAFVCATDLADEITTTAKPEVIVDDTMDDADAGNKNLEELHALLDSRVRSALRASDEIGKPVATWVTQSREELRDFFGLVTPDFAKAPVMKSKKKTVAGNELEYIELPHPDQVTIRALRMFPKGRSRGIIVLMHGWPGHPADLFKNTGSGASGEDRGYGLELVDMGWTVYTVYCYHSKHYRGYYAGLKHAHNFVQLSREARVVGDNVLSIELRKLDYLLSYLDKFERPEKLVFAGISMGGHYAVLIGALHTGIDVTICSSWFDDYYGKYLKEGHPYTMQYLHHEPIFMDGLFTKLSAKKLAALHYPRKLVFERDPNDLPLDGDKAVEKQVEMELGDQDFITVHTHSNMHHFTFKDVLEKLVE